MLCLYPCRAKQFNIENKTPLKNSMLSNAKGNDIKLTKLLSTNKIVVIENEKRGKDNKFDLRKQNIHAINKCCYRFTSQIPQTFCEQHLFAAAAATSS